MVERLFLMVPRGCLRFVIVVFPDHTHLLFLPRFSLFLKDPFFQIVILRLQQLSLFLCGVGKTSPHASI